MKTWLRCKRLIVHLVRILINSIITISKYFASLFDDEQQTTNAPCHTSSSPNMNGSVSGSEQNHGHCQQRTRNVSGSATMEVYYKFFNVKKFKLLAVLIVVISASYHGVLHLKNGHNTCKWLLTDGRFQGYNEWQPHGCMMHKYTKGDFQNCMHYISYWGGRNHFAFVGDSRIRQLYYEFVRHLSKKPVHPLKAHSKLSYQDAKANVLVEFLWAPMVDNSMKEILEAWVDSDSTPRLVVVGSATWSIKLNNGSEEAVPSFKSNLTTISSIFSKYKDACAVMWVLQDHVVETRLFPNRSMITNRQIDLYNRATIESLISSKVQIWSSSVLIGQGFLGKDSTPLRNTGNNLKMSTVAMPTTTQTTTTTVKTWKRSNANFTKFERASSSSSTSLDADDEELEEEGGVGGGDGLHLPQEALEWDIQVLLNMLCNNYMNFDDGSCCTTPENPTTLQIALAIIFGTSLTMAIFMTACKRLASVTHKVNTIRKANRIVLGRLDHFVLSNKTLLDRDMELKRSDNEFDKGLDVENHIYETTFGQSCKQLCTGSELNNSSPAKIMSRNKIKTSKRENNEFSSTIEIQSQNEGHAGTKGKKREENEEMVENLHPKLFDRKSEVRNDDSNDSKTENDSSSLFIPRSSSPSTPLLSNSFTHSIHTKPEEQVLDLYAVVCCVARLGLVLFYFFICDRTTFFMKENKYYTHVNFFLPFTYLMVLGLFFTEKTKQVQVLNRNQTDEWKGWMQIVILIYHLTGASKVLSMYMQIRVMVSAYLFLSAYGHFSYFLNKNDFSLHRLCTVIVRFNFLVVLLCLAMDRTYQFYYFVPLVTFWFVVIYFVMASPPRVSSSTTESSVSGYCWLILKIIVLTTFVTLLYSSEVFFEKIFLSYFLKPLFVSPDDSVYDWRFRWSLDRYSSIHGLVFSLILVCIKKTRLIDGSNEGDLLTSRRMTCASIALSLCGLVCYAIFTSLCQSKTQCNETHSYIAFVPILCYIVLRNMLGCVRRKFSAFFAWFGKISLELFIAQYHIWLAADTHGILVLIPSYPVLNLIVTSFVFVCVAHEIKTITSTLMPLLVPASRVSLLRNILLVLIFFTIRHFLPF